MIIVIISKGSFCFLNVLFNNMLFLYHECNINHSFLLLVSFSLQILVAFIFLFLCLLVLNFIVTLGAFFRCLVHLHHLLLFQSEGNKKLISTSEPSVGFIHSKLVFRVI